QVVWNLLSNAVKFTPGAGSVTVELLREGSATRIIVSDTGAGISQEFLPHLFERFRQAEGGSRRRYGGLGLGLSIVKHIVGLHGGTVFATSDGLGRGSTFTVELPASALRAVADREVQFESGRVPIGAAAGVRLNGLRVLVVDD